MHWRYHKHYKTKGTLIHTCAGYNKLVEKIENDGTVVLDDGANCDFEHCCSPPRTKKEIEEYFLGWGSKEGIKHAKGWWPPHGGVVLLIAKLLKKGETVFDDKGCLTEDMKKIVKQKTRKIDNKIHILR